MSILLLAALLASFATLGTAVVLFFDGETGRARRILMRWLAGAAAYAAVLIVSAMLPHQAPFRTGVPYCEDDVCMSVEGVTRTGTSLRLNVRLSSRANHGPRSTAGASVYLTDQRHRIFRPVYDASAVPFDAVIQPGGSINTSLNFNVPADAGALFFEAKMDHIRYASFLIGSGDLFERPVVRFAIP